MASQAVNVWVVEDDTALREMLTAYLQRQGMGVRAMASAEALFVELASQVPDLLILDVGLPGMDGLDACRRLRQSGNAVPVILLTARSEEIDRVLGLEMGADDYLSKPFSARELVARVRAVMRRVQGRSVAPTEAEAAGVPIGEVVFRPDLRSLACGDELRVLNRIEFDLLAELVAHTGVPVTRERLFQVSHEGRHQDDGMPRAVDVAIMRLRRLIEPVPAQPRYIQTVRGVGYVFVGQ